MAGIVYILTNQAMPGYVKIGRTGKTADALERRLRDLDNTSTPLRFECFYAALVDDPKKVENRLHQAFSENRVSTRREFFEMNPSHAQAALEIANGKDMTPNQDTVADEESQEAPNKTRRPPFKFSMVDIKPGTELKFKDKEDITCTTRNWHNEVEFRGEITSLANAATTVAQELSERTAPVGGPYYWMFENEQLSARRDRFEEERAASDSDDEDG